MREEERRAEGAESDSAERKKGSVFAEPGKEKPSIFHKKREGETMMKPFDANNLGGDAFNDRSHESEEERQSERSSQQAGGRHRPETTGAFDMKEFLTVLEPQKRSGKMPVSTEAQWTALGIETFTRGDERWICVPDLLKFAGIHWLNRRKLRKSCVPFVKARKRTLKDRPTWLPEVEAAKLVLTRQPFNDKRKAQVRSAKERLLAVMPKELVTKALVLDQLLSTMAGVEK